MTSLRLSMNQREHQHHPIALECSHCPHCHLAHQLIDHHNNMSGTLVQPSKLLLVGSAAFRSFRCVWMLEELQVPFQQDFMARPGSKAAGKHHPLNKIPSLVVNDGEFCLYESAVINTFLGDTYGNKLVPPPRTYKRVKYDQTVTFLMSEMDAQALWIHRKHKSLGKIFGKSPEAVTEAKRQFDASNQVLVDQLSPYLLGDDFTAADILYVHCLEWAETIGWNDNRVFHDSKLVDYLKLCRSRDGYQRTVTRRGEEAKAKEQYLKDKEAQTNRSRM